MGSIFSGKKLDESDINFLAYPERWTMTITRRKFIAGCAATLPALHLCAHAAAAAEMPRKRIAFLGTEVSQHSHSQHFLDRLKLGYSWGGGWQNPRLEIASIYVDQFPRNDLGRERIKRYGLKQFPSVAEALTLGSSKLAVDGVVIIGEQGKYATNEKGQCLYPRYEWFKEVVKVFEMSGRAVPVFNDKHLSTTWARCAEMVKDSKRLGFPFLAGSSLPLTRRLPAVEMPYDAPLAESVCVGYGEVDSYDFHGLETAQCMSERRAGGEVGIRRVQAVQGEEMWKLLAKSDREQTRRLLVAALARSHTLPTDGGYLSDRITFDWARRILPNTLAYFIEHRDDFRTTLFLTDIRDFNYAGVRSDNNQIISCQMYLPMPDHGATSADFFNPLIRLIETMVLDEQAPYPVERTLLTSGMTLAAVDSLHQGQIGIDTPEMEVRYRGQEKSLFWQS